MLLTPKKNWKLISWISNDRIFNHRIDFRSIVILIYHKVEVYFSELPNEIL